MLFVVLAVGLCIAGSALAAGLTLGLLSLDQFDMLVLLETDPEHCDTEEEKQELIEEQASARLVRPLLEDHHRLLVTLLLLNCVCAEMLPLFLDELFPSWLAVLLSVTFILMFGEIIPSAIFSNAKNGLNNSAKFAGVVQVLLTLLSPVAVPIGRILDYIVGEDDDGTYSKPELRSLLRLHQSEKHLTPQQSKMMGGAMDLMTTKVFQAMTPVDRMFMLSTDDTLDGELLADILGRGYTRIPVYHANEPNSIKGILLTLSLIVVDSTDTRKVGEIGLRHPPVVSPNITLHDLLDYDAPFFLVSDHPEAFAKIMRGHHHSPRVTLLEHPPMLLGCVTSQDVMKCLTKRPMRDEYSKRQADTSSSSDEGEEGDEESTPNGDYLGPEATQRIKRWAARARETLVSRTERTKLLPSNGAMDTSSLAYKLNTIWQSNKRQQRAILKKVSSNLH